MTSTFECSKKWGDYPYICNGQVIEYIRDGIASNTAILQRLSGDLEEHASGNRCLLVAFIKSHQPVSGLTIDEREIAYLGKDPFLELLPDLWGVLSVFGCVVIQPITNRIFYRDWFQSFFFGQFEHQRWIVAGRKPSFALLGFPTGFFKIDPCTVVGELPQGHFQIFPTKAVAENKAD